VKRAGMGNAAAAKKKPTTTKSRAKRAHQSHCEEDQSNRSSKQTYLQQKKKGRRSAKKSKKSTPVDSSSSEDDEETFCLVCMEPFSNSRSKEVWIQCTSCKMWAHELCTARDSLANMFYVCDNCESDSDMEPDDC